MYDDITDRPWWSRLSIINNIRWYRLSLSLFFLSRHDGSRVSSLNSVHVFFYWWWRLIPSDPILIRNPFDKVYIRWPPHRLLCRDEQKRQAMSIEHRPIFRRCPISRQVPNRSRTQQVRLKNSIKIAFCSVNAFWSSHYARLQSLAFARSTVQ